MSQKAVETKSTATEESQIRKGIDNWVKAVRAKDINGVMSNFAPDVLTFNAMNPLQSIGLEAARKLTEEWFASMQGPIGYEIDDLSITTGDSVAFCHSLNRMSGKSINGEEIEMWVRSTVCYRKVDGRWLVTHQHISVPFDVESGKASLNLKP
jgi:uncharacterized protein (TIGR02246 family)